MIGIAISIIIVTSADLSASYAWIPFLSSTILITILILLFDKDEVSLRSLLLAAVSSVVAAFLAGVAGIAGGALLAFQGISAAFGLGGGIGGLIAAATTALAGTGAAAATTAVIADPSAALRAASLTPLPDSPPSSPRQSSSDTFLGLDLGSVGDLSFIGRGRKVRRGGRKFLWRW